MPGNMPRLVLKTRIPPRPEGKRGKHCTKKKKKSGTSIAAEQQTLANDFSRVRSDPYISERPHGNSKLLPVKFSQTKTGRKMSKVKQQQFQAPNISCVLLETHGVVCHSAHPFISTTHTRNIHINDKELYNRYAPMKIQNKMTPH